jgi:hypothetical protein
VEDAEHVGGELSLHLRGFVLLEETQLAIAGVVHEHVDAVEPFDGSLHGGPRLPLIRDVERHR